MDFASEDAGEYIAIGNDIYPRESVANLVGVWHDLLLGTTAIPVVVESPFSQKKQSVASRLAMMLLPAAFVVLYAIAQHVSGPWLASLEKRAGVTGTFSLAWRTLLVEMGLISFIALVCCATTVTLLSKSSDDSIESSAWAWLVSFAAFLMICGGIELTFLLDAAK